MGIIYAATSLADWVSALSANTGSLSAHTLECVNISSSDPASLPPLMIPDDFWLSFYYDRDNTDLGRVLLEFFNSDSVLIFRIFGTDLELQIWNGSSWVEVAAAAASIPSTATRIDVHINSSDTGVFEVFVNGVSQASFSGDTNLFVNNNVETIRFHSVNGTSTCGALIVADEDTRGMIFCQGKPTGAGGAADWTGAYTTIDEEGFSDADVVLGDAVGEIATYVTTALPAAYNSGYDVVAVVVAARCEVVSADLLSAFRASSTNYEGESFDAVAGLAPRQAVNAVNPATAAAWTFAEADAVEVGMKIVAS